MMFQKLKAKVTATCTGMSSTMSEYSDDNIEPLQIDSTCKSEDTAISSPSPPTVTELG